ncbi:MAG: cysteine dioxygenase [Candidatus Binatia bacterium]
MSINRDLSLTALIKVLQGDASVMCPARMQDILERLVIPTEEIQGHTLFSEKRYARNLFYKTAEFEIMVMCWNAGQRSSIHDHAGSLGGLKILYGELTESLFEKGPNDMIKSMTSADYTTGETRVEETSLIHQISNLQGGKGKAISVHIYMPPLVRMNVYSLEDPSVRNVLPQYFSFGSGI